MSKETDEIQIIEEAHIHTSDEKLKFFGYGEWVEELDFIQFSYKGYICLIRRIYLLERDGTIFGGHLNGYVIILKDHRLYGNRSLDISCHGGITFNEINCYLNSDESNEFHVIGFDCSHSGDYQPGLEKYKKNNKFQEIYHIPKELKDSPLFNPVYRNIEYVMNECKDIVDQLIEMDK